LLLGGWESAVTLGMSKLAPYAAATRSVERGQYPEEPLTGGVADIVARPRVNRSR